jgi:hypothetical protein
MNLHIDTPVLPVGRNSKGGLKPALRKPAVVTRRAGLGPPWSKRKPAGWRRARLRHRLDHDPVLMHLHADALADGEAGLCEPGAAEAEDGEALGPDPEAVVVVVAVGVGGGEVPLLRGLRVRADMSVS